MKRLSLIPMGVLLLLVLASSCVPATGRTPPTEYTGTSSSFGPGTHWDLYIGYVFSGDVLMWHWNSSGNVSFSMVYTAATTSQTFEVRGFQSNDGLFVNTTGFYDMKWYNNDTGNVTVDYVVDWFTPLLAPTSPTDGGYVKSGNVTFQGVTEGFATGVLIGPDAAHLEKAAVSGRSWSSTMGLQEGRNTVVVESYYWFRPLGATNFTVTRTINVTVDSVPPLVSIVSPANGSSIRGYAVQVYWNCSDAVGLSRVDMKVDNGSWVTVSRGNLLGLGSTSLGLSTGKHTIDVRGVDLAGNEATASVTVHTDSSNWSLGGPMYGLPSIGIMVTALVLILVAYWSYRKPPQAETATPAASETPSEEAKPKEP